MTKVSINTTMMTMTVKKYRNLDVAEMLLLVLLLHSWLSWRRQLAVSSKFPRFSANTDLKFTDSSIGNSVKLAVVKRI